MRYKVYKNKLTVIMRQTKKEYYNERLKENKGDFFVKDDKVIKNMTEVVNGGQFFFYTY